MNIVDRIRALANSREMSLPDLEVKLGLGNGTISRWRTGSPNTNKLEKVADYFDVSMDHLMGREKVSKPESDAEKKVIIMTRKAEEHLTKEESEHLINLYTKSVEMYLKNKGIKTDD